jgi:hypothetical protein
VPTGAGAADRPQETLYFKFIFLKVVDEHGAYSHSQYLLCLVRAMILLETQKNTLFYLLVYMKLCFYRGTVPFEYFYMGVADCTVVISQLFA